MNTDSTRPPSLRSFAAALCATALCISACATRRDPVYIARDLPTRGMSTIGLAPIVDVRDDPFEDVRMLSYVRRTIENALREKGYGVVAAPMKAAGGRGHDPAERSPAQMSDSELATASPKDVAWLMVVSLERAMHSAQEFGDMSRVKISGRLVDVAGGVAVWRDTAEGEADIGGLLTVLTGPSTEYEGAYDAARLLISTLPDGPEKGRLKPVLTPLEESTESGLLRPLQPR